MNDDLTAGEFQAMTGLTAKALRLYAERGIVSPAAVDPTSGYRSYARTQLRHGMTLGLLRRAQVSLAELAAAEDFSFEQWRQRVELRRHMEDFYLDVAEHVATFDLAGLAAHERAAPAVTRARQTGARRTGARRAGARRTPTSRVVTSRHSRPTPEDGPPGRPTDSTPAQDQT